MSSLWDLNLQVASSEAKVKELLHAHGRSGRGCCIVLSDLIPASNAQINATLPNESRDVSRR